MSAGERILLDAGYLHVEGESSVSIYLAGLEEHLFEIIFKN